MVDKIFKSAQFIKSAVAEEHYPPEKVIEVVFIGKSNVGKSSLMNRLMNRRKLSKVSKTPGCTRCINFFLINDSFYFVDLPGFGFSKVSHAQQREWREFIEEYLSSKRKKLAMLLVDARRLLDDKELTMYDWVKYYNIDQIIVVTKIDKVTKNELALLRRSMKERDKNAAFISSLDGTGIEELKTLLFNKVLDKSGS